MQDEQVYCFILHISIVFRTDRFEGVHCFPSHFNRQSHLRSLTIGIIMSLGYDMICTYLVTVPIICRQIKNVSSDIDLSDRMFLTLSKNFILVPTYNYKLMQYRSRKEG